MPRYENGQVYIIRNFKDDRVYIGSTTQTLAQRMTQHRTSAKNKKSHYKLYKAFNEIGVEQFYIERLEEFSCRDKTALLAREGHFIRAYDSVNNGLNGKAAGRSNKEWNSDLDENTIEHQLWIKFTEQEREARNKSKRERHHERYQTDPEYRSNCLRSHKLQRANATPEARLRHAERVREFQKNQREKFANDPEYRAKYLEGRRLYYIKGRYRNDPEYREQCRLSKLKYKQSLKLRESLLDPM